MVWSYTDSSGSPKLLAVRTRGGCRKVDACCLATAPDPNKRLHANAASFQHVVFPNKDHILSK